MGYTEITPVLVGIRLIEFFAHIFLLSSVMNKKLTKKEYAITSIIIVLIYGLSIIVVPEKFKFIAVYLIVVIVMKLVTKIKMYQIMIGYLITTVIILLIDMVSRVIFLCLFNVERINEIETLEYYLGIILVNILIFMSGFAIRYFKMTFTNFDEDNKDIGIAFNALLTLFFIFPTLSIIYSYIENRPLSIQNIVISIASMLAILILSIFNSQKRYNLLVSQKELEYQKSYNTTLQSLVDSLRTFKHDYNNTLSTLYGYVQLNDINSLKRMFKEILEESRQISSLDKLNPSLIKEPNIFGLLTTKYQECVKRNIKMDFEIFTELDGIDIKIYYLTRILGIFLDNAIEAASGSEKKKVNLIMSEKNQEIIIKITNTYSDKEISVEKIYEKGISSKGANRGLGLYKAKEIIKRYSNMKLNTVIDKEIFMQKLTIEKTKSS